MTDASHVPERVLGLWFPDDGHWNDPDTHTAFWETRMQGGMDRVICSEFAGLTEAAARGLLDHWAETPRGRLALLIALDQFPRSLWRDTPAAYGQDIKAARLALEGIRNGHYAALRVPWEKQFYIIAISHCEGPDHLERMDMLVGMARALAQGLPASLDRFAERSVAQAERVRGIIERFGRHPHRNAVLGRISTPDEEAYIAAGDFPHVRKMQAGAQA
jgi:uncharacterized protein (DUF924 family)